MAAELLIEAREWAPQTQLNIDPIAHLTAQNAVWMSALAGDECVGIVGAHNISWPDGSAELAVGIPSKWRGKNGARVLADRLHDFCFKDLGLRRLTSTCLEGSPMAKVAARCGLLLEGRHVRARLKRGEYLDSLSYALMKEEA